MRVRITYSDSIFTGYSRRSVTNVYKKPLRDSYYNQSRATYRLSVKSALAKVRDSLNNLVIEGLNRRRGALDRGDAANCTSLLPVSLKASGF